MTQSIATQIHAKLTQAIDFQTKNNFAAAQSLYEEILTLDPRNPDAWHLLGVLALRTGDLVTAKARMSKAVKLKPNDPSYLSNLGIVLKDQGNYVDSLASLDRALRLKPDYPEARSNRGLTLAQLERHDEAIQEFDRAIELRPSYAAAHSNRGISLQHLGRMEEAEASFRKAIGCDPNFSDAWNNYAALLRRLRRYDESLRIYDRALTLDPRNAKGFQSRGELFAEINRPDDAFRDFDRALAINPRYPDPLWAKGFTYLKIGEFDKGWDLYDFRFDQSNKQAGVLNTTKPRWTPMRRAERVLVWSEQGIGDELFFAQWLGRAHELGSEVIVAVDGRLIAAHARSFQNVRFVDKADSIPEGSYESHLPLGSLPKALRDIGIDWRTSKELPFLRDDARQTSKLKNDIARHGTRTCGITWRSTRRELGAEKSLTLNELLPVLKLPGYTFVNLQYGDTADELAKFRSETGIDIVNHPDVDNLKDLDRHISLVAACDELVLACNATTHIAGAMGRQAHVLAPRGKSLIWYWANRTENHSLWYPSIELFDQSERFSWQSSINRIAKKLSA